MYKWLLPAALLLAGTARAQYYYNDLLSNRTARDNYLLLKSAGIKTVLVSSYDPDGEATQGFSIRQELDTRRNVVETTSQTAYSNPSTLVSGYSAEGWPATVSDSSDASATRIFYTYTGSGASQQLGSILSSTGFPGENTNRFNEVRQYTFGNGRPATMLRIKNGRDTLRVTFVPEEHGWIGEERWTQKGRPVETYYYYYNEAGQLTDIARYNRSARRILPDYTFEWDAQGHLATMVTVITGTNQYRTWRYTYDTRGLKTGEVVYNKYRQQEGKLVYNYQ